MVHFSLGPPDMIATDRLGRDMLADALARRMTLVIAVFASSFLLGLLMVLVQRATHDVSRSVTTPATQAAPNWNVDGGLRGSLRR
jgi:uncharacterized membrane protein YdcZ (DUF606 family)